MVQEYSFRVQGECRGGLPWKDRLFLLVLICSYVIGNLLYFGNMHLCI